MSLQERPTTWVALAGFMGTGKSRIGWELSRALALHFIDTDKLITRIVGQSVTEIFAEKGERFFRSCEQEIVERITRIDHAVISLGGGAFVCEQNRKLLLERGPIVILWASADTIYQRTRHSDRPLLQTHNPLLSIEHLLNERNPFYRQGNIHIQSDGRPSGEIVEEIIEQLWRWQENKTSKRIENYDL